ncbi:ABC transporter ATP-binding protein [Wenzhouxiangella sp. AB-CW3]|uniref:ABC transporter ATP-binding protein n=1 Tax=Wenzhouxiangella sp. AB-CW3 TaxID=2771012 RepID=UPI00168C0450|nr:ABC transporter ATP-binding protein [Wenzhouxiangella sp. AB-CW3]QOC23233.1 ABC transporter ATP-binding protein [Wenzhouxiangella sp. AB-CW3]
MLVIDNLSKTYDNGVQALDDVSLTIPPGMFGLLGPNGAGKSTLMRTIATLQPADRGSIHFDGIDVSKEPDRIRSQLGYLPQDFNVYPRISAEDLLDHLALLKGMDDRSQRRQVVETLLVQTNLHEHRKKHVASFSGGMRQRFGIAQALIGDPSLLIVDEPTAGLDPEERNRFHNLLAEIGSDKVILLSTHIVDDVADLCPQMAVIADGRIQLTGAPSELIHSLEGRIWCRRVDRADVESASEDMPVISTRLQAGKTVIHVLSEHAPGPEFEAVPPDLEDVYFSTLFRVKLAA